MKLTIQTQSNYLAKIVYINKEDFFEHSNADSLKCVKVDYNNVITSIGATEGFYVYFPTECAISEKFLCETNSYRDEALNTSDIEKGFFEKHGRVKAMKLRGEYSQGYIVPVGLLHQVYGPIDGIEDGLYFDTVDGNLICKKYEPKPKKEQGSGKTQKKLKGNKIKDIIVEDQFKFHTDTPHLARELNRVDMTKPITITRKMHGSSLILSNVLVKRKLNFILRILKWFGVSIQKTEYGIVWSSGKPKSRIPKGLASDSNEWKTSNESYYSENIWKRAYTENADKIEKGISLYGEIVGKGIQGDAYTYDMDYGIFIYKITSTNADGITRRLSWEQVKEYCEKYELTHVAEYFNDVPHTDDKEEYLEYLSKNYLDKSYHDCKIDEGICVQQGDTVFKLKSPKFVVGESKALDTATEIVE